MDKTPKVWLTREQTESILSIAKSHSNRDWLILTLCRYGLRIGEILGRGRLPGILVKDLRQNGVWIIGKHGSRYSQESGAPALYPLPVTFASELIAFSVKEARGKERKLFSLTCRQMERIIKMYSKEAGIVDWKWVRPHRLRAFFATDLKDRGLSAFEIRDMMRHSNIITTNIYVGHSSTEARAAIMETLS